MRSTPSSVFSCSPFARAPHHDAALDLVQVEDVRRLPHRQPRKVRRIHGIRDLFLLQQRKISRHLRARKPVPRLADRHLAQHPRRKPPAGILSLNPHRIRPGRRPAFRQFIRKLRQRQPINRRRLARHAVVVHRIHAVGGNVHLVKRAVALAEIVDALDGNPAQRQIFSQPRIIHRQSRQICSKPFRQYLHLEFLRKRS